MYRPGQPGAVRGELSSRMYGPHGGRSIGCAYDRALECIRPRSPPLPLGRPGTRPGPAPSPPLRPHTDLRRLSPRQAAPADRVGRPVAALARFPASQGPPPGSSRVPGGADPGSGRTRRGGLRRRPRPDGNSTGMYGRSGRGATRPSRRLRPSALPPSRRGNPMATTLRPALRRRGITGARRAGHVATARPRGGGGRQRQLSRRLRAPPSASWHAMAVARASSMPRFRRLPESCGRGSADHEDATQRTMKRSSSRAFRRRADAHIS